MKKLFFLLGAAISLASCTTITKTATTADTPAAFYSATVADLEVAKERITYTMTPSADIQRGGLENVKRAAENEALLKNGNADVLVDAEYVISMTNNWIFGKKVNSITNIRTTTLWVMVCGQTPYSVPAIATTNPKDREKVCSRDCSNKKIVA